MQSSLTLPLTSGLKAGVARAWGSPAFWRYLELGASRGAPLLLHTFLLVTYGAAGYAYPAWVLGVVAIVAAFLPDSQGYLLVRTHGEGAWRLARAAVPYVWLKTSVALALGGAGSWLLSSTSLTAGLDAEQVGWLLGAALFYSASDQLWGFSSQLSLARGNLSRVTLIGVGAKGLGLGGVTALHLSGHASVAADLIVYAAPTLLAAIYTQPGLTTFRRTWRFNSFALTQYALWAQGVSLLTAVLTQAIPQGAGLITGVSAATVGQLAYAFRWLGVGTMLLQVLQGLVTQANRRVFGRSKTHAYLELVRSARRHPELRPLYLAFRWGGAVSAALGLSGAVIAFSVGAVSLEVALTLALYSLGLGFFSAYRFELALAVSRSSAKSLLLRSLLPAFVLGGLATLATTSFYGLLGLAAGVALTFALFALAWRRVI